MKPTKVLSACVLVCLLTVPVFAYEGLSIATSFPSISVMDDDMIIFNVKVKNFDLPPQRVDLRAIDLPEGWTSQFVGGGGLVDAVFVEPQETTSVQLWVTPNQEVSVGTYHFKVQGRGSETDFTLPLSVSIGKDLPERLSLTAELPVAKGTPSSDFVFNVEVRNNSARDVLVNLDAQLPEGFSITFSQQYGQKDLSTLPLGPGDYENVKVSVSPPYDATEGQYPFTMIASTEHTKAVTHLTMDIKGAPNLMLAGTGGLLSGSAVAGKEKVFTLELKNNGSAPAQQVKLSSYTPSNWNVEFTPDTVERLDPDETRQIQATVRPSSEAITGDYNVTLTARSQDTSVSENFRITIKTSSLWGIIAVIIIAAAALVLVFAVRKFGRR